MFGVALSNPNEVSLSKMSTPIAQTSKGKIRLGSKDHSEGQLSTLGIKLLPGHCTVDSILDSRPAGPVRFTAFPRFLDVAVIY